MNQYQAPIEIAEVIAESIVTAIKSKSGERALSVDHFMPTVAEFYNIDRLSKSERKVLDALFLRSVESELNICDLAIMQPHGRLAFILKLAGSIVLVADITKLREREQQPIHT